MNFNYYAMAVMFISQDSIAVAAMQPNHLHAPLSDKCGGLD